MSRSLDQEAAAFAWKRVEKNANGGKPSDDYVNTAKASPALIMSNGLMQTLAYYQAKNKTAQLALLEDIVLWLGHRSSVHEGGVGHRTHRERETRFSSMDPSTACVGWVRGCVHTHAVRIRGNQDAEASVMGSSRCVPELPARYPRDDSLASSRASLRFLLTPTFTYGRPLLLLGTFFLLEEPEGTTHVRNV